MAQSTLEKRFWAKVERSDDNSCWLWTGYVLRGYGRFESTGAHRVAYELLVAPIPPGLHLDHLCRVTRCVNPSHLEPVTQAENNRRASAAQTHCKRGHEFTPENTYRIPGRPSPRTCRECAKERSRRWWQEKHPVSA